MSLTKLGAALTVLALASACSPATVAPGQDPIRVGSDATALYFLERDGLQRNGALITYTTYLGFSPESVAKDGIAWAQLQHRLDCAKHVSQIVSVQEFSKQGSRMTNLTLSDPKWQGFVEGSVDSSISVVACDPERLRKAPADGDYRAYTQKHFSQKN